MWCYSYTRMKGEQVVMQTCECFAPSASTARKWMAEDVARWTRDGWSVCAMRVYKEAKAV